MRIFLMQTYLKTLSTLFVIMVLATNAFPFENVPLRLEVLLDRKMLGEIEASESFVNSLDITSNRLILLSTTTQFYLLGWGGLVHLGKKVVGPINSYAYTPDGLLMIIRNNKLCVFDSLGNLSDLFGLPSRDMGLTTGKNVMYIYDRNKGRQNNALYAIAQGGKYSKLFEIPAPINSVAEMNEAILFATGSALFSYSIANKELTPLFALPKEQEIISIAADAASGKIYFSTASMFYVLNDKGASLISDQFGGVLRCFGDGLIVFDPGKKLLIRIAGLGDKSVASE